MVVVCKNCGIDFEKKNNEVLKYKSNYCTRICYFEWQRNNTHSLRIEKVCSNCGCSFYTRKSAGIRPLSFCTRKCQYTYFRGGKSPSFRSERKVNDRGYILILKNNHPRKVAGNYVYEHILVMEEKIGRFLEKDEVVHHINGVKGDNRIENLEILTQKEHRHKHSKKLKYEGLELTLREWSVKKMINLKTLSERLRKGWEITRALETATLTKYNPRRKP